MLSTKQIFRQKKLINNYLTRVKLCVHLDIVNKSFSLTE